MQNTPFVLKCMNMRVKLINLQPTLKTYQIRWLFPVLSPWGHLIYHDRAFSWLAFAIFSELTIQYLSKDQIKIDTIIAIYCLLFLLLDLFWAFPVAVEIGKGEVPLAVMLHRLHTLLTCSLVVALFESWTLGPSLCCYIFSTYKLSLLGVLKLE